MTTLPELDESAFRLIDEHLKTKKLQVNRYRGKVGEGKSQCFGMVGKRSMPPDLSRQSWLDPRLHGLLMDFGRMYVPIPFTSIQVNDSFRCKAHKDKGNVGQSYIVAFGNFQGGELVLDISGVKTSHNIRHRPILFDGSQIEHETSEFTGRRISIVYHTIKSKPNLPMVRQLSEYETVVVSGVWMIACRYPGQPVFYLGPKKGLPHPLKNRKKKEPETVKVVVNIPGLSKAQTLMAQAAQDVRDMMDGIANLAIRASNQR